MPKAIIIGGGIGGLSTAVALSQTGWDVQVLERTPVLQEIGAGLQIAPNGTRILARMGVMAHLESQMFEPAKLEMRNMGSGRKIFDMPLGLVARTRWGAPYIQIHRGDLSQALQTVLKQTVPDALTLGAAIMGYGQDEKSAWAVDDTGQQYEGDVLIAADGVHSVLRQQMHPTAKAQFANVIAWRATVLADDLGRHAPPPHGMIWVGKGCHCVSTRIRGGDMANFVALVDTNDPTPPKDFRAAAHADLHAAPPPIRAILDNADDLRHWPLNRLSPLPHWHQGRVAILGDAAHPMVPCLAQGAVQAIEDAAVLADLLGDKPVAEALKQYSITRLPRATKVQEMSYRRMLDYHSAPLKFRALSLIPNLSVKQRMMHQMMDWVYSY